MKKALIITYYWPPSGGAGVQRWLKFVKYFRDFGWEPVIYTPENPEYPESDSSLEKDIPRDLEVIKRPIWEPYNLYKKFLGRNKEDKINAAFTSEKKQNSMLEGISVWIRGNFFIPDARRFWIRPSVKFLRNYLSAHPVDAIISTGPPHSMHLIASQLSAELKLPWLADFRDPWTNIDFYKDLKLSFLSDHKHRRLEKKVLTKATRVTVIGQGMAKDFDKIVPRTYDVITNGFDPDDIAPADGSVPDKKFSIAHIGTLSGSRNPVSLWAALKELVHEIPSLAADLEIKLVGKVDFSVLRSAEESGLSRYLSRIPYLPHNEVVICQQQSQVLLLIINNTPNAGMILTGKFFEYLAAGRPILCLGPENGDAATILRETGAGLIAGFGDVNTMKQNVLRLYQQYKEGISLQRNPAIDRYSRKELTRQMTDILAEISR
ncbi:MAG TPA: glycosyltransferase family 4 protein [Bacteroidales bacterium]|nr:glycosyltransferase family 4 protein [Bacteroidales bacterium]HPS72735.1 glycosyltransferase family 4 protein [Bacteroidales bacterium]